MRGSGACHALFSLLAASLQLSSVADAFTFVPAVGTLPPQTGFSSHLCQELEWGGIPRAHGMLPSRRAVKHAGPAMMVGTTERLSKRAWISALASAPLARGRAQKMISATSVTFRRITASVLLCVILLTSALTAFPSRVSANSGFGSGLSAAGHIAVIEQSAPEASRSVHGAGVRNIPITSPGRGATRLAFVTPQEATGASRVTPSSRLVHDLDGRNECLQHGVVS